VCVCLRKMFVKGAQLIRVGESANVCVCAQVCVGARACAQVCVGARACAQVC